jgi:hypothetical protein
MERLFGLHFYAGVYGIVTQFPDQVDPVKQAWRHQVFEILLVQQSV